MVNLYQEVQRAVLLLMVQYLFMEDQMERHEQVDLYLEVQTAVPLLMVQYLFI